MFLLCCMNYELCHEHFSQIKSKIFIEYMQAAYKHKIRNRQGQTAYARPRVYDEKLNCSNLDLKHDTILVFK